MKYLFCDICRKQLEEPINRDRDIFFVADIDLCEDCKEALEKAIRPTMRAKKPFDYGWYKELLIRTCHESIQKGKVALPTHH